MAVNFKVKICATALRVILSQFNCIFTSEMNCFMSDEHRLTSAKRNFSLVAFKNKELHIAFGYALS